MGNYQRFESGAGWLLALVGLGAQYMTTRFSLLGLTLSFLGVAVLLHRFWNEIKRTRVVLAPGAGEETYAVVSKELLLTFAVVPFAVCIPLYVFFSSLSPTQVATVPPLTQMAVDSPNSTNVQVNTGTINSTVNSVEPLALGKYVCVTRLPVLNGKYELLVEFGIQYRQTNGVYVQVEFNSPSGSGEKDEWFGSPLRRDKQKATVMVVSLGESKPSSQLVFWKTVQSPSITPQMSFYLLFKSEQPLDFKGALFLEDFLVVPDRERATTLARQYEECPLLRKELHQK